MTLTLPLPLADDPSVFPVHDSVMSVGLSSSIVNSTMKFVSTWAFIAIHGLYSTSN